MNVLITGGAGYLGSRLASQLDWVTIIDKYAKEFQSLKDLCYSVDLEIISEEFSTAHLELLQNYDAVIHLASVVGAKACEKDKDEATRTNLELTKSIISKRRSWQVYIFTNTNSGYSSEGVCDETTPLRPNSHYGKTKVEAERIWLDGGGISLRFASLFGPSPKMRHDLLLNFLVREAVFKKKIEVYESTYKRNFLHVSDAVRSIRHIIDNGTSGESYNVGIENENYTKLEVCKMIQKHLPATEIVEAKGFDADPDQRNYIVTNKKIMRTGYQTWLTINDGINELIKYYNYVGE